MAKLLRVIDGNIIEEDESKFDVRPLELRRQRIEGFVVRIADIAAVSRGSLPEVLSRLKFSPGKLPSRLMRKVTATIPLSPM